MDTSSHNQACGLIAQISVADQAQCGIHLGPTLRSTQTGACYEKYDGNGAGAGASCVGSAAAAGAGAEEAT